MADGSWIPGIMPVVLKCLSSRIKEVQPTAPGSDPYFTVVRFTNINTIDIVTTKRVFIIPYMFICYKFISIW